MPFHEWRWIEIRKKRKSVARYLLFVAEIWNVKSSCRVN